MKRIYILGMMIFAFLLAGGNARAQVIEACAGADSVKLRLDNFLYGNVQWQQSDDNIEWEDIEYATDTVYVFKPERTRYYRAMVFYESCPFDTSQATLVRVTAQADAGPDKVVQTGLPTFLYGNMEDDAWGEWTFLEGTGGVLSDLTDNMPVFTGTDTLYRLLWTLSNVCGSTSDTVEVEYVESEYYDAIVMVDTTDLIVSDTSEMEMGFYKIVFNTPVPNITDTTVLIGVSHDGGFLRKVYYHEYHGDTCWMVTKQATLDDILISGVINIENYAEMSRRRAPGQGKFVRLDHFPTRAEMQNIFANEVNKPIYYFDHNHLGEHRNDPNIDFSFSHSDNSGIALSADIILEDLDIQLSPFPSLKHEKRKPLYKSYIAFGFFNSTSHIAVDLHFNSASFALFTKGDLKKIKSTPKLLLIPNPSGIPIPVVYSLSFTIPASISASGEVSAFDMRLGVTSHFTFNASIDDLIPDFDFHPPHFTPIFNITNPEGSQVSFSVSIGLEFGLNLYEIFTAYVGANVKGKVNLCLDRNTTFREREIQNIISAEFPLGFKFRTKFGHFNISTPLTSFINKALGTQFDFQLLKQSFPNQIFAVSGNNQSFNVPDALLPQPLRVKVPDLFPTPVYFETINGGTISHPYVYTDIISGEAQTFWRPSNLNSKVKATVYGCNQDPILQTIFRVSPGDCHNTTLNLSKKYVGERISVDATGGYPPYTYYLDGVSFGSTPPVITPEPGVFHHFVVVDATLCSASADIKTEPFSCSSSTLSLGYGTSNIEGFANPVLFLFAEGGAPPYTYLLDGDPNSMVFQPDPTYYGLTPGNHTAYVKDSLGCVRSCSFQTDPVEPKEVIVVTMRVDNVGDHSAKAHATLYTEDPSYVLHRGVCWDIQDNPTVLHSKLDYTTACQQCVYDYNITGLSSNTTYFVRAYAITPNDTIYGNSTHFLTTAPYMPNVTSNVSNISYTSARASGEVLSDGGSPVTARGICWGTTLNPSSGSVHTVNCGSGLGEFSCTLTNLAPGTCYYVRTFATNSSGTAYSDSISFFTLSPAAPEVETDSVYNVTASSATASGRVIDFNSDSLISRGFCWSLEYGPTVRDNVFVCGSDTGHFVGTITELLPDTFYFLSAFAINDVDTGYGAMKIFRTDTLAPDTLTPPDTTVTYGQPCDPPTLTDYDGNVYHAVQIGSQCWMQENLRTTSYANGNPIAMGHTGSSTNDAYRYAPENDMSKVPLYGYLYNWPALVNGSSGSSSNPSGLQGVCPNGWHVPSNAEWNDLANTLGINYSCGGDAQNIAKALASTTNDWYTDNSNACAVGNNPALNNQSGFTAMPAGFFTGGSMPSDIGPNAYFATSTAGSSFLSYFVTVRYISYSQSTLQSNQELKSSAFSVRCVRNQ